MSTDLVKATAVNVPATGNPASLPELVERAGGAARFAWEEFFYAEHHNPHTQKAYPRLVGSLAPAAPQPSPTSPVMCWLYVAAVCPPGPVCPKGR